MLADVLGGGRDSIWRLKTKGEPDRAWMGKNERKEKREKKNDLQTRGKTGLKKKNPDFDNGGIGHDVVYEKKKKKTTGKGGERDYRKTQRVNLCLREQRNGQTGSKKKKRQGKQNFQHDFSTECGVDFLGWEITNRI